MLKRIYHLATRNPGLFGLCVVAACAAIMNACYGMMSATSTGYGLLLAGLYAGSEMAKWVAADACGEYFDKGDPPRAIAAGLLALVTLCISYPAHVGFVGSMRSGAVAEIETKVLKGGSAKEQIERTREELKTLKVTRSVEQITAAQELVKEGGGRWLTLEKEKADAKRAAQLMAELSAAEAKLEGNAVGAYADPRVAVMKWVWPERNDDDLQLMLSIFLAGCFECVTLLGFFTLGARGRGDRLDLEALVASGAATVPLTETILPFKSQMLEQQHGARMSADQVIETYEEWAAASSRQKMQSAAMLRLLEATGVRRMGDVFINVRRK